MTNLKNIINGFSNKKKINLLLVLGIFVLVLSIALPSLARLKNRSVEEIVTVWDGSVATSYRKGTGTSNDPYTISSGAELAYFSEQLQINNYENKYFVLNNNIMLNEGVFSYNTTDGITYILNGVTYYVSEYSNQYYDNSSRTGTALGTVNIINSLDNFKGHLNGNSYSIYGLYITDANKEQLGLFNSLSGSVNDLYVENSMVYGGTVTGGIASSATNANITNVLFDGYVVGKNVSNNTSQTNSQEALTITPDNILTSMNLTSQFVKGNIISSSLTGTISIVGDGTISINGTPLTDGEFNLDLGTDILSSVSIESALTEGSITISEVTYNVTYNNGIAGGIIAVADTSNINNVINKAYVYGKNISSGITGLTNSLIITNSYNIGSISSDDLSSGIIGLVKEGTSSITNTYNSGEVTSINPSGIVGSIRNSVLDITNTFNTTTKDYMIISSINSTVNINNSYNTYGVTIREGLTNGSYATTTIENLNNKTFLISQLLFNEYISVDDLSSNPSHLWIYEDNSLPILYIDDIKNPIANIYLGTYSWNNLSEELSTVRIETTTAFSIEGIDQLKPVKEISYYIQNSNIPLMNSELPNLIWNPYTSIVNLTTEGFYIIYAKVTDYNDNIYYLNTDIVILDLTGSTVTINKDDKVWDSNKTELDNFYINDTTIFTVTAFDDLSGIANVKYYVTDTVVDTSTITDELWIDYGDNITISNSGNNVIYVKATDNCGYVTIVNTDYIVLNGYTEANLTVGRNTVLDNNINVTSDSVISMDISYQDTNSYSNYTHNLVTNMLLPLNTKLTFIDKNNSKIYEYIVDTDEDIFNYETSCNIEGCIKTSTIPLSLFEEVGKATFISNFDDTTYGTEVNENFKLLVDFSQTSITTNYNNIYFEMVLKDNTDIVRSTLQTSKKYFNLYTDVNGISAKPVLSITTDYAGTAISLKGSSKTNININSVIRYQYIDVNKIYDSSLESKKMGLAIKMIDSLGNVITKDNYANLKITIDDQEYYPGNDNITRISLDTIEDVSKTITISAQDANNKLADGTYYFVINNYVSYDGLSYSELGLEYVSIPVTTGNINNVQYGFDVMMEDSNKIIRQSSNQASVIFNIIENGNLINPNIRVSLYRKNEMTAYNQDYSIIDLKEYVSNTLEVASDDSYFVTRTPISYNGTLETMNNLELNLLTYKLDKTGYKYVFELYDGDTLIAAIDKKFIVK